MPNLNTGMRSCGTYHHAKRGLDVIAWQAPQVVNEAVSPRPNQDLRRLGAGWGEVALLEARGTACRGLLNYLTEQFVEEERRNSVAGMFQQPPRWGRGRLVKDSLGDMVGSKVESYSIDKMHSKRAGRPVV